MLGCNAQTWRCPVRRLELSGISLETACFEALQELTFLEELVLDFDGVERTISRREVALLGRLRNLRRLVIVGGIDSDSVLAELSASRSLKRLEIVGGRQLVGRGTATRIRPVEILGDGLDRLTSVELLTLRSCRLSEDGFAAVAALPNLRRLTIEDSEFNERSHSIVVASEFPKLFDFAIRRSTHAPIARVMNAAPLRALQIDSADSLSAVRSKEQIRRLAIFSRDNVTMDHMRIISSFRRLESLTLHCRSLPEVGLGLILEMNHLRELEIKTHGRHISIPVFKEGIASKLRIVILKHMDVSDVTMERIARMPVIEDVRIVDSMVADDGCAHLCSMMRLCRLSFANSRGMSDDVMMRIGAMPLSTLDVTNVAVSPEVIERALANAALDALQVSGTGYTMPPSPLSKLRRFTAGPEWLPLPTRYHEVFMNPDRE